jgi:hypothetical protein
VNSPNGILESLIHQTLDPQEAASSGGR